MSMLSEGEVHAFYVFVEDVPRDLARERLLPLLDAGEAERHARFLFDEHRHLFLVAHALCRSVLAAYTGLAPEALRFAARAHGKPELLPAPDAAPLRFNLSHTAGLAAVAVAQAEIGVDVERLDRRVELEAVARRVFSPAEVDHLMASAGVARRQRFFERWTLKEAYVKALGDGLTAPLRDITITYGPEAPPALRSIHEPGPVWLHLAAPGPEHVLALALRAGAPSRLRLEPWPLT
jgi:4'-phosphopantetheinyl transferase